MKFCLFDISNLVHRMKHALRKPKMYTQSAFSDYLMYEDQQLENRKDENLAMVVDKIFTSIRISMERFNADHCVACFDKKSWRRNIYPEYKANRRKEGTPEDERFHQEIIDLIDDIRDYLKNYTNVTVLEIDGAEADDFIGRWVEIHSDPEFSHVIISPDSDFKQLVSEQVELYIPTGSARTLYTLDGVYYQDGKKPKRDTPVTTLYGEKWKIRIDEKTQEPELFDPGWELFFKCVRGDSTDNIKSAYPKVRETKMREAFEGDDLKWNNFINSSWGPEENKQYVRKRFEFNRLLIDLTAQPDWVKEKLDYAILNAINEKPKRMIGAYFAKFCSRYQVNSLLNQSVQMNKVLSAKYD